jgi:hypothetical protein
MVQNSLFFIVVSLIYNAEYKDNRLFNKMLTLLKRVNFTHRYLLFTVQNKNNAVHKKLTSEFGNIFDIEHWQMILKGLFVQWSPRSVFVTLCLFVNLFSLPFRHAIELNEILYFLCLSRLCCSCLVFCKVTFFSFKNVL